MFDNSIKGIERKNSAILSILQDLRMVSRFKDVEEYQRKKGVIRADIKVSKYVFVRMIVDLRSRIPDQILIGYMHKSKFNAVNSMTFKVPNEDFTEAAKKLEKMLYLVFQKYHHRFEKALRNDKSKKD